ncbi:MAG: prolyl oligopeptidase family serine peptidase [Hyphomicrobiaceae bacterium]
MPAKKILPFGTWPSQITPELAAKASRRFGTMQAAGNAVYWSESRPEEGGRQVILRVCGKRVDELLPAPWSARSRVHEYGGGEFLVAEGTVFFVNDQDQQVYRLQEGAPPQRITSAPSLRFADFAWDTRGHRLVAVAEVHAKPEALDHPPPRNTLVGIALVGAAGAIGELASGRDFYASPRLSPDGTQLAFLAWDLPDMPWDSAALYVARVQTSGALGRPRRIAGGDGSAVFQPEWDGEGRLYFAWDEGGWGSLYRWHDGKVGRVRRLAGAELWRPQWVFGSRCFALHPDGRIAAVYTKSGLPLLEIGTPGAKARRYPGLQAKTARIDDPVALGSTFAALVSRRTAPPTIMRLAGGRLQPLGPAPPLEFEPGNISKGEAHQFKRPDGQIVNAFYYPPANLRCRGPANAAPPALVLAHGGPTSMTDAGLKMRLQFFTSRGFAVCDVNYSGSTGYGRAYRERLDGAWGIADIADCAAAARHLARSGLADGARIAIGGGSAGGYTTLMALATTDAFAAGSCHYGVSDLGLLLAHTHKFESGYLHRLMGTTPGRWKEAFAQRSPINLIAGIRAPVILFQGLEDRVVPPEQSRLIVAELRRRGIDVDYREFAGEGHGFRQASTIIAVLEAELAFLVRALKLAA